MRTILSVSVLFGVTACLPDFETLDEACHEKVPREGSIENSGAVEVVNRVNCYRRLAKVPRGSLDKKMQEAAENHMAYMKANPIGDGLWVVGGETPGNPGFTGTNIIERLKYLEHPLAESDVGYWQTEWLGDGLPGTDRVDFWFPDVFSRESYLQPSWIGAGYAETVMDDGLTLATLTIMYQDPVQQNSTKPVIFPRDGQVDVPTTWTAVEARDPFLGLGPMGYPISFQVGGDQPNTLQLVGMNITGPDGAVEYETLALGEHDLRSSAGIIPKEPLQPSSTYTVTGRATWGIIDSKIDFSFTTRANTTEERGMLREAPDSTPMIRTLHITPLSRR